MSSSTQTSGISEGLRNGLLINTSISGCLGIVLNAQIIWILVKKLRKGGAHGDIKLCTFVAFTDLLVSIGLIFRSIFAKYPYNIFKYHPYWCKLEAGSIEQLLVFSGYSLGVMSLERFLLIGFNIKLSVYVWFSIIAIIWISQLTFIWIAVIGGLQSLSRIEVYCTILPIKSGYNATISTLVVFFASFFSVIISYTYITIVKFNQCLNQIKLNVPKEQVYIEFRSTLAKSAINISIFTIVFFGKLYNFVYEISTGKKRSLTMDIVSNSLIIYCSIANTLILLYMNQEVRNEYIELLISIRAYFSK